ncbi:hypothetical protein GEMRC1_010920 [Eukaryota sp. GEM-RC1]
MPEFHSESIVQLFNEIDTDANLVDFNSEAASTCSTLATSIVTQIASQIEDVEKRAQNLSSFASLLRLTKKLSAKAPDSVVAGFLVNSNHTFVSFCEETIALCLTNLKHAINSLEIVSVFVDVSLLVLELFFVSNASNEEHRLQTCSTAAIFGNPSVVPIPDDAPTAPINPYGHSKLMVEELLKSISGIHDMTYVALRYFNASGAHPSASIGESHRPETHLIPIVLQVALGQRTHIKMFGSDYNTRDGTCVRDYIHVLDLASAHYKALLYLREGNVSNCFNLGSGIGYFVKEVIETARKVTGHEIFFVLKLLDDQEIQIP